ncbi:hypothetical protein SLOPH_1861 [Spraguea lophii 42_110]|uniref:SKP1 component POZ domain-containing protein n=1 Tax=Spraguea lophii (strain 42_110) TaxID=1358809 RepID=S7XFG5_SPRLO|nr:hypothetical protein SLOPH_1861 [Spraguea lophii 42_110]
MYKIRTKDKVIIPIDMNVIERCTLLQLIIKNTIVEEYIDIYVDSSIFKIIIDFMNKNKSMLCEPYDSLEILFLREDEDFIRNYSTDIIIQIINGCNYLQYFFMMEVGCKCLADRLKNTDAGRYVDVGKEVKEDEEFDWISSSYSDDF